MSKRHPYHRKQLEHTSQASRHHTNTIARDDYLPKSFSKTSLARRSTRPGEQFPQTASSSLPPPAIHYLPESNLSTEAAKDPQGHINTSAGN